jgi:hypothetical protein
MNETTINPDPLIEMIKKLKEIVNSKNLPQNDPHYCSRNDIFYELDHEIIPQLEKLDRAFSREETVSSNTWRDRLVKALKQY